MSEHHDPVPTTLLPREGEPAATPGMPVIRAEALGKTYREAVSYTHLTLPTKA